MTSRATRGYVFGGADLNNKLYANVDVYAPAGNKWSVGPSLPVGRAGLAAVAAPDGRLYAIGGTDGGASASGRVEALTPATRRWATAAQLPNARNSLAASVGGDGRIYAIGGTTNGTILSGMGVKVVEAYGPIFKLAAASGKAGASIAITSGSNFAANATVGIYFDDVTSKPVITVASDATGKLPAGASFVVPAVAAGAHTVILRDSRSRYPVRGAFAVSP